MHIQNEYANGFEGEIVGVMYLNIPFKDIYLFGGKIMSPDGAVTASNEIYKLSIGNITFLLMRFTFPVLD